MEETIPSFKECKLSAPPLLSFEIPPPPPGEPPPLLPTSVELVSKSEDNKSKIQTTAVEIVLFSAPVFAGVGMLVFCSTFLNKLWLDPSLVEAKSLLRLIGVELIVICYLIYVICHTIVMTNEGRFVTSGVFLGLLYCLLVFLVIIWSVIDQGTLSVPSPLNFKPLRTGITLASSFALLELVVFYNWWRIRYSDSLWTGICSLRSFLFRDLNQREKSPRAIHVIGVIYLTGGLLVILKQDVVLETETFGQSCRGLTMYSLLVALHGWLQVLVGKANCLNFSRLCLAYRLVFYAPLFTILFLTTSTSLKITVITAQSLNLISIVAIWCTLKPDIKAQ